MSKESFSNLYLFDGLLGKSRSSSGSGNIGSNIDNAFSSSWDAPAGLKAQFAFNVIWAIVCFLQLVLFFKRFGNVARGMYRGPFILLGVLIFFLGIGYIVFSFKVRLSTEYLLGADVTYNLTYTFYFFYFTNVAFFPAVCLYLLHVQASILGSSQGGSFNPLMSRKWKNIIDVGLIGLLYLLYIVYFALIVRRTLGLGHGEIDSATASMLGEQALHVYNAVVAFKLAAYLDIMISSIVMFVQVKKQRITDPIIKRLSIGTSPLFLILFIESLTYHVIYWTIRTIKARNALVLYHITVDGFARASIAWMLISLMTVPGIQWNNMSNGGATALASGYFTHATPLAANQQQYPWQINGQPNWQQQSQPTMQYTRQHPFAPPQHPPPGKEC